jgi:drug/metabolite transporter (DMT)-like permease
VGSLLALVGVALASARGGSGGVEGASSLPSVLRVVAPALLAALAWGLYSNLSRLWGTAAPAGAMTFFLLASGLALLGARCFVQEASVISLRVVLEVAYMAVFPTLLAYTFWDTAARLGSLSLVASFGYLTPVLSIAVSAFYLAVPVAGVQWAGGAFVVVGAVLSRASVRENAKEVSKTDAETDAKTDAKTP